MAVKSRIFCDGVSTKSSQNRLDKNGMWLQQHLPTWDPNRGETWHTPGVSWYKGVKKHFAQGDFLKCTDRPLREKQKAYIAYTVLFLPGSFPDPKGAKVGSRCLARIWFQRLPGA